MNVIFLDFDEVLNTYHNYSNDDIERKIIILSDICKEYNCKVVIEASAKDTISEDMYEIDSEWVKFIFKMFNKYGIDCIGKTPNVIKKINSESFIPMWKEDEIRLYLFRHHEIEHFCIIDDDLAYLHSDLDKLREYLLKTKYYSKNPLEEGLLETHKEEIEKILKKDNNIRKLILKYKK